MSVRIRAAVAVVASLLVSACELQNMGTAGYTPSGTSGAAGSSPGEGAGGGAGSAAHAGSGGGAHGGAHGGAAGVTNGGSAGVVTFPCETGRGDCDGNSANGCESDFQTSVDHCGSCTHGCLGAPNAMPRCTGGQCFVDCAAGFADCDGDASNGCETDLGGTVASCGACGHSCPSAPGATPMCTSATCGIACVSGKGDCDGDPSNGCETDLGADPTHCGACANVCGTGPHATPTCNAGNCNVDCEVGFASCDGDPTNGCEVDLGNSPSDCGACGNVCPGAANAVALCNGGACSTTCAVGFSDCNGLPGDGCEANLSDPVSCGSCTHTCGATHAAPICSAGACFPQCDPGYSHCSTSDATGCETNIASDPTSCGICGNVCGSANGSASCVGGACKITCTPGFADCDFANANGCEASLAATTSCGACGHVCGAVNGSATCSGGACVFACNSGFAHCSGIDATGCETSVAADANNCGACGFVCGTANATPSCVNGGCVLGCDPGFKHCKGSPAAGCETSILADVANCGDCGHACGTAFASPTCSGGACVFNCASGHAHCSSDDSTGCETLIAGGDPNNCGGCGKVCGATHAAPQCVAGACELNCDAGWAHCSSDVATGCETSLSSPATCGSCTHVCGAANGTPTCAAGTCTFQCAPGYAHCSTDDATGCETNVTTDATSCGACGHVCGAVNGTASCTSSKCAFQCTQGFAHCSASDATGCETSLTTDAANCGACGHVCGAVNGTATCTASACAFQCSAGYAHCGASDASGCDTNVAGDPLNCGACGHSCLGTKCVAGQCEAVAIASGEAAPDQIVVDGTSLLWTAWGTLSGGAYTNGFVRSMPKDASTPATSVAAPPDAPWGIAVDATNVYFTTVGTAPAGYTDGTVQVVPKTGGMAVAFASSQPRPMGIAVSATRIFWTRHDGDDVWSMAIDGSGAAALVTTDPGPAFLLLGQNGLLYWAAEGTVPAGGGDLLGAVQSAKTDGTGLANVVSGLPAIGRFSADASYVYVPAGGTAASSLSDGTVTRVGLNGASPVALATGQHDPFTTTTDGTWVYWTNAGNGTIARRLLTGAGAVEVVSSGLSAPHGLTVDASHLYVACFGDGTIRRIAK